MKNIFISYGREDLTTVEKGIIPEIKSINGADCWFDFECIETGADSFNEEINKGIENSFIFIMVLSEKTMHKDWPFKEFTTQEELRQKDSSRKTVILKLDDSEFAGHFAEYKDKYKDIISWNKPKEVEKMKIHIKKWIKEKANSYFNEGKSLANKDFKKAFDLYMLAAEMGNAEALSKVAYYYHTGKNDVVSDPKKALSFCEEAYKHSYKGAESLLASIYLNVGNIDMYQKYLMDSAYNGWSFSQYRLGRDCYEGKNSFKRDIIRAIYWLKNAAENIENRIPDAWILLGDIMKDKCIDEEEKAIDCYKRAKKEFLMHKEDPEKEENATKKIEEIEEKLGKIHSTQGRNNNSHKTNSSNNIRRPHDKGRPNRRGKSPSTHK